MKKIRKGKILRIKHGYNPNSSSMGSIVFALPCALLAITVAFGAVGGVITAAFMKPRTKNISKQPRSQPQTKKNQSNLMERNL